MVFGGSLGNIFDRLYYSAVVDFIDIHINNIHWFIFNFADIFITIGVILLIVSEMYKKIWKINNIFIDIKFLSACQTAREGFT